jgi:hypothetical protein
MKVDFRKIEIESINGEKEAVDLSKVLGNALYSNGKTLEVVELARAIWRDGEVEIKAEEKKILEDQIPQLFPTYVVSSALLNALK